MVAVGPRLVLTEEELSSNHPAWLWIPSREIGRIITCLQHASRAEWGENLVVTFASTDTEKKHFLLWTSIDGYIPSNRSVQWVNNEASPNVDGILDKRWTTTDSLIINGLENAFNSFIRHNFHSQNKFKWATFFRVFRRKFFHLCTERRSFHYTLSKFVSRLVRERNHAAVESRTVDDSCCFIFCNSVLNCWILQTKFPHAWRNGTWATGYKQATFLWNLASTIFQNVGLNGKIFRETLKLIRKFIWTKFIRLQVGWEKSW